jgi:hypothetical protein
MNNVWLGSGVEFLSLTVVSTILIPISPLSNYPVASIVSPVLRHSQSTDSLQCSKQYVTGVSRYAAQMTVTDTSIVKYY